jgi:putative MATE family efflux protein
MKSEINLSTKSILFTAVPVMLGSLIQFFITFTDTAFLGRLGELALNTAGNSSLVYMTALISFQGFCEAYQILVAKFFGKKDFEEIKSLNQRGILFFTALGLLGFVIFQFLTNVIISPVVSSEDLESSMISYLQIRSWGFVPAMLQLMLIYYFMGMADTRILSYAMLVTAVTNIVLDYGLIFGELGLPKLGINGAAVATVIAESATFLFSLVYLLFHKKHRPNWLPLQKKYCLKFADKVLKKGSPLMVQRFFSMGGWAFFFIMLEILGSQSLAASQIIRTLYFLAFIPVMGFSTTTRTYVSYFLSIGKPELVKKGLYKISLLSLLATFVVIHGFWFYPEEIIGVITTDKELIQVTSEIIVIISYSMLIFAVASIFFAAIAGIGDSTESMFIEIFCLFSYLALAYLVSHRWGGDVKDMWLLEFVYFSILGIISFGYFKFYRWKTLTQSN